MPKKEKLKTLKLNNIETTYNKSIKLKLKVIG